MKEIYNDSKKIENEMQARAQAQRWKKLVWLLLFAGLGGGAMTLGPQFYDWAKNYGCAKQAAADQKPDAALECLERFSPKTANLFVQFGMDLRNLYLTAVNRFLELRQYQKALDAGRSAWSKFPWEPAFLGNQALALFGLGKFQEAVDVLEAFLKLPQLEQMIKVNGARVYLIAAEIYLGAQNTAECEKYLNKALEAEPENISAHLLFARLEGFRQNFDAMAGRYEKVLAGDAKQLVWQDLFLLALHYLNAGQLEKFHEIFARSRRDFPNASGFHLLLAVRHLKAGNYASAYYEILFEKEVGLTDAAYFKDAVQEIEAKFQEVFKMRPAEAWFIPLYQFIQGKQAYENKNYQQALPWIEQSLRGDAHPLQSLYLGRVLAAMGQTQQAIGYYGQTLNKQETFALASAELAGLYLQRGAEEAAKNLWLKALAADPKISEISPVGTKLRGIDPQVLREAQISRSYTDKLSDHLMRVQLNQAILNSFKSIFRAGI